MMSCTFEGSLRMISWMYSCAARLLCLEAMLSTSPDELRLDTRPEILKSSADSVSAQHIILIK